MYNLTYDTPYHNDIRRKVNSYGNVDKWEPCYDKGMKGGARQTGLTPKAKFPKIMDTKFRREDPSDVTPWKIESDYLKPGQYSKPTYRSGTGESWSYFGRNYQANLQKLPPGVFQHVLKGGATRPFPPSYEPVPQSGPIRKQQMKAVEFKGQKSIKGGISKKDLKEAAKAAAKKGVSKALDIGIPATTGFLGQTVGVPAPVAAVVGAVAREGIKKLTGFGRGGVGKYGGSDPALMAFSKLTAPQKTFAKRVLQKLAQIKQTKTGKISKRGGGAADTIAKMLGDFVGSAGEIAARGVVSVISSLTEPAVGKWLDSIIDTFTTTQGGAVAKKPSPAKKTTAKTTVAKKSPAKATTNPWVTHLKKYAAENGISYREALKSPEAKSSYKRK